MSVVKHVDFANKQRVPDKPEVKVADLSNGYFNMPNQLEDALCEVELSGREFRVLNAIIRLTYGWNKNEDRIQNILIEQKTKLSRNPVSEIVGTLENRRIIHVRRIGQNRYISINKNVSEWVYTKTRKTIPENKDNHPRKRVAVSPKKGITKDTIPNTVKDIKTPISPKQKSAVKKQEFDPLIEPIPEWLDLPTWKNWVEYRNEIKKPFKTKKTFVEQIKFLTECHNSGVSPVAVIEQSIMQGWTGLFPLKNQSKPMGRITQPSRTQEFIPENF
ncbi:replication protein [Providencia rettgeri]